MGLPFVKEFLPDRGVVSAHQKSPCPWPHRAHELFELLFQSRGHLLFPNSIVKGGDLVDIARVDASFVALALLFEQVVDCFLLLVNLLFPLRELLVREISALPGKRA